MARSLTLAEQDQVQKPRLIPVYFVAIEYVPDPVYAWTGTRAVIWNGITWEGVGSLLSISDVTETVDDRDTGITLELSGIDHEMLGIFSSIDIQNSLTRIYLRFLAETTHQIITDPIQVFGGRVDVPSSIDGDDPRLRVTCEGHALSFRRKRERRWTGEDQRIDYPADKAFDYVPQMPSVKLLWGSSGQNGPGAAQAPYTSLLDAALRAYARTRS